MPTYHFIKIRLLEKYRPTYLKKHFFISPKLNENGITTFSENQPKYALSSHRNTKFTVNHSYLKDVFSIKTKLIIEDNESKKLLCLFYKQKYNSNIDDNEKVLIYSTKCF